MPEQRVPEDHPLRPIREMTNRALKALSPRFSEMYSPIGRALLLQILYTVRSGNYIGA
jgi:hypothetical protein